MNQTPPTSKEKENAENPVKSRRYFKINIMENLKTKTPKGKEHIHFGPQVVVKFHDFVEFGNDMPIDEIIEKRGIGNWKYLQQQFPGIELKRMITSISEEKLDELVSRASETDRSYRPVNFKNYFYINCPSSVHPEDLKKELARWKNVQNVYVDYPAPDPVVNDLDDPRAVDQDYLDAAPIGIDARYAWGFGGGDGAGQQFIDMERGWTLNHEDLSSQGAALLHGTLLDSSRSHGTSVLGEICSVDNTLGCVGIVPNIAGVNVVSYNGSTRVDAIIAAIANLQFGNVLLLEAQVTVPGTVSMLGPCEVLDGDFDAIRLATALGIVVVEAGGNGTNNGFTPPFDLDAYIDPMGKKVLFRDPANADFRDSGAIIVSASSSAAPHTRMAWAPHGKRIDCYAWGENINTLDSNSMGATSLYRINFGGTSGASPIITGAALSVQGMIENNFGYRLSPRQMRVLLSDPNTGTLPDPNDPTEFGVLPNLHDIIDNTLNLGPDVYLRDFVGDVGEPHNGPVSSSPDIISRTADVANPQGSFGAGSGNENNALLSQDIEMGQDNYIFVRVLNQGGSPAVNVKATVYWSPPATLITPDMWNKIGDVTIPNVPTAEVLTVSNKITWPSASIPALGHYCFIGLVGNASDPAPDPADFLNWNNFVNFIRNNNNVTWKNFNVVNNDPSPDPTVPEGYVAMKFLAPGAPDERRPFQFEIIARLPEGSRAFLEIPQKWLKRMDLSVRNLKYDRKNGVALIPIKYSGKQLLEPLLLEAKSKTQLRLLVHIPKKFRDQAYTIAVRQIWEEFEVGRITFRIAPKEKKTKSDGIDKR